MLKKSFSYTFIFIFLLSTILISCDTPTALNSINFIDAQAYYCINSNNTDGNFFNIYFKLKETLSFEELEKIFNSAQLVLKDNTTLNTNLVEINKMELQGQNIYFSSLFLNDELQSMDFDAIAIRFNNKKDQTYPIGNYHFKTIPFSPPKKIAVIESPIIPQIIPSIKTPQYLSYKIMTTEKKINDSKFILEIPNKYKNIMTILETQTIFDKNTTKEMYSYYRKYKSEKELENFKIYSFNVKYYLHEKVDVIFQPLISSKYGNEKDVCAPATPLIILY